MPSLESIPSAPGSMSSLTLDSMPSTSEPGSMPSAISSIDYTSDSMPSLKSISTSNSMPSHEPISPMPLFAISEKKKRRTKKCKCAKKKGSGKGKGSRGKGKSSRSKHNRISQKKSLYEMYSNNGNSNF